MSEWKARRFWTETAIAQDDEGWQVLLDGRRLRSPAKAALILPNAAVAEAVRAEWDAQEGEIDPASMPLTRAANATIDKVIPQQEAVARMLAAYGGTDLVCYRAEGPPALIARQAEQWDPLLEWASEHYGARLRQTCGVMPVMQERAALEALAAPLFAADPFTLTALHDLITLPGSLVIGLAVAQGRLDLDQGWAAGRVDAAWQEEQWGQDDEAAAFDASRRAQFSDAYRLLTLVQS